MYLRRERRAKQTAKGLRRVLPPAPQSFRGLLRSPLELCPFAADLIESLLAGYSTNDYVRQLPIFKLATAFNTVWAGPNNINVDTDTIDFFLFKGTILHLHW